MGVSELEIPFSDFCRIKTVHLLDREEVIKCQRRDCRQAWRDHYHSVILCTKE